jgi:hypothetical protein
MNRQDFPAKSMKRNYFMLHFRQWIYNCPVPLSDTPVCVAGEVGPVLVGMLSTQVSRREAAENEPLRAIVRRACVA